METPQEKYARVQAMIVDDGGKWDLSPNDKSALRHVLHVMNSLADELSEYTGESIPIVLRRIEQTVSTNDSLSPVGE